MENPQRMVCFFLSISHLWPAHGGSGVESVVNPAMAPSMHELDRLRVVKELIDLTILPMDLFMVCIWAYVSSCMTTASRQLRRR